MYLVSKVMESSSKVSVFMVLFLLECCVEGVLIMGGNFFMVGLMILVVLMGDFDGVY